MTASPNLIDYLTGQSIPDVGAESHRQALMRYLVEEKGYPKAALWANAPIDTVIGDQPYRARIDLIVTAGDSATPCMAFKCCAGSLGSREREILAAARIFGAVPIPLAVVSDGRDAILLDTANGKSLAHGLEHLPSPEAAARLIAEHKPTAYPKDRLEREKLIFRTYDQDNINILRPGENT